MNIAKIPFINSAPYFQFLSGRWLEQHKLLSGSPKELGDLARAGKLDAGLFSLIDAWQLIDSGHFEWLGSLGIAGHGPIGSILLCGVRDPSTLAGMNIGISPQTATTVKLLQVWLEQKLGIKDAKFVGLHEPCAAQLLIGDDALRRKLERGKSEAQIDLCEAWTQWTRLPFVFARWAVRTDLPPKDKKELALSFSSALDLALDDLGHVSQELSYSHGLPENAIGAYLKGIRYHLKEEELKGAEKFKELLQL